MRAFPVHTVLTIVTFLAILFGAARVVPGVKLPELATAGAIVEFTPELTPASPLQRHPAPEILAPIHVSPTLPSILDDRDGTLDHFYAALWRTERGEPMAITRIEHYGDSPTTADLITGDTRQILQKQFGDAGHGFTLIAKPWAWYEHRGVDLSSHGWQIDPGTRADLRNGMFGLGGVVFSGHSSAYSKITLRDPTQTRLEVWFLRQPNGGSIELFAGGEPLATIETAAPSRTAGFARFDLHPGVRMLELRTEGEVRLFGITVEKPRTGVVYDSLGVNGASISMLALLFNERHWAEELRHRNPDLVFLYYGTNESGFAAFLTREYEKELREAIRRVRAALPNTSILVMSPMDRGQRDGDEIRTLPTIPRIVDIQRRVARELHCGFFNTFEVMGGEGTMARWYEEQPRLVSADLIHPTPAGARLIAVAFARELVAGLIHYKLNQVLHRNAVAQVR